MPSTAKLGASCPVLPARRMWRSGAAVRRGAELGESLCRTPLDQHAVDSYLSKHVVGFTAPSKIQQFSFGQSCVAPFRLEVVLN